MPEKSLHIDIYRKKTVEEFTALLADPEDRCDTGSAAAATASVAAALLARSARICLRADENSERLQWLERNSEILRSYMVKLIDEDIKCRTPLRKALKEDDRDRIDAARQIAVSICSEIVNMMGKCLEMGEELLPYTEGEALAWLLESAELAYASSRTAVPFILQMGSYSDDETYRYVLKRENELTLAEQKKTYDRIHTSYPV